MIRLCNNHSFEYMTASGAMGYDGKGWLWEQPLRWFKLLDVHLFTHVIKTLTLSPKKGNLRAYNPLRCIRPMQRGAVNAVGLTNPGFYWWVKNIGPKVDSSKIPLIASIFGEPEELGVMTKTLNHFDIVGLELNASCPNTNDDIPSNSDKIIRSCAIVKKFSRHPVLLKLSVAHDVKTIVPKIENMVEALSINSVPWHIAFPNRKSPLAKYGGGGVSGKIAQPFTWLLAANLKLITRIPIIAPSIWDYEDIGIMKDRGFEAFSFGSVFLCHPWWPTYYIKKQIKSA